MLNGKKSKTVVLNGADAHIQTLIATGKRKIKALAIKIKTTQDAVEKKRLRMEVDSLERKFQKEYRKAITPVLEHLAS